MIAETKLEIGLLIFNEMVLNKKAIGTEEVQWLNKAPF